MMSTSKKYFGEHMAKATGDELYEFLTRQIISSIAKHFGSEMQSIAAEVANEVCDELVGEWGGTAIYLPRRLLATMSKRNEQIFREFGAGGCRELARKYGLSEMRIHQIISAHRAEKKNQRSA